MGLKQTVALATTTPTNKTPASFLTGVFIFDRVRPADFLQKSAIPHASFASE